MVNSRQYKMLKRISKYNLFEYTDFSDDESEIIKFLADQGFVAYTADPNTESRISYKKYCRITQSGYAEIYSFKVEHFRFWIPSVISLIALLTSILSLSTTAPDVWNRILQVLSSVIGL